MGPIGYPELVIIGWSGWLSLPWLVRSARWFIL